MVSPGIYFKVLREGEIGDSRDEMQRVSREKNKVPVKDIVRLYVDDKEDIVIMRVSKNQGVGQGLEGSFSATNRESYKVDDECMLEDNNNISNNLLKASQYNES